MALKLWDCSCGRVGRGGGEGGGFTRGTLRAGGEQSGQHGAKAVGRAEVDRRRRGEGEGEAAQYAARGQAECSAESSVQKLCESRRGGAGRGPWQWLHNQEAA